MTVTVSVTVIIITVYGQGLHAFSDMEMKTRDPLDTTYTDQPQH